MVDGWAGILYLGHVFGANILKIPELTITKDEAGNLSVATINVMRHFAPLGAISEKMQDISAFVMVAGSIYVPRMGAAADRKARAKAAAKAAPPPTGINPAGGFETPPHPDDMEVAGNA